MKTLLVIIFLLTVNSVKASDTTLSSHLYKCIHLVQNSHSDPLSREIYAYVTESQPCPPPTMGGINNQYSSELNNIHTNHNANKSNQLKDSTLPQVSDEIDRNMHHHKGNKVSLLHMVTEPECIWFKEWRIN